MSKLSSIGIIGAGHIGVAFARALARRNIPAIFANSRGPESLQGLVQSIGPSIRAGTREQAAAQSIVLVAVNWSKLPAALSGLANFAGRIVIDSNNPIEAPLFNPIDLHGRTSRKCLPTWCRAPMW
jgi:predicted dinucleotide-binding enzyme